MLKSAFIALLTAGLFLADAGAGRGHDLSASSHRQRLFRPCCFCRTVSRGIPGVRRPYTAPPRRYSPNILLAFPGYYADYSLQPIPEPQPQVVVVQGAPAPAPQAAPSSQVEPLILELHGDRYVQVSGPQAEKEETVTTLNQAELLAPKAAGKITKASPPQPLPPVTLVYRDGHREQVGGYTIIDGTLYAQGDYWSDGYWTKKIQLSALNLPATKSASQKDGVNFMLPSSPNEVVTRP